MRTLFVTLLNLLSIYFISCSSPATPPVPAAPVEKKPAPHEQAVLRQIDSLKEIAQDGDLITRANDNIVSYHLKNFNEKDKSFSHAGIIVTRNGQKLVCNIDANDVKGLDTVRYDPIDSFLNPVDNSLCALFRYELSETEKTDFIKEINGFHDKRVHFDRVFDLNTDSLLYCSEMIAKSMKKATHGRILFTGKPLPKEMIPLLIIYFDKIMPDDKVRRLLKTRRYIAIDHLYLVPGCKELMRFKLKYFPGE